MWPCAESGVHLGKVACVPFLSEKGIQLSWFESSDGPHFPFLRRAAARQQLERPRRDCAGRKTSRGSRVTQAEKRVACCKAVVLQGGQELCWPVRAVWFETPFLGRPRRVTSQFADLGLVICRLVCNNPGLPCASLPFGCS